MCAIGVGQHRAVQPARARQVVRVAGRRRHRRRPSRVHAIQAVHAQVAAADQVQVARARAQDAVAQAGRLVVERGLRRAAPGGILLAHAGPAQAVEVDHVARLHAGVSELFRARPGPHVCHLQHAQARVVGAKYLDSLAELAGEFLGDGLARHDAGNAFALAQFLRFLGPVLHALRRYHHAIHAVMAVGQAQGAVRGMRLHGARVGPVQVGAGYQAHAPRLRAVGQHGRDGPQPALAARHFRAQFDGVHARQQLDVRAVRDQRADGQHHLVAEGDHIELAQQAGQGDAFRPGHGAHLDQLSNHAARVEARAGGQGLRRGQQGARSVEDLAGAVAHGGRQHRAGRQGEHLVQDHVHGQARVGADIEGLDGHVVIERDAAREDGAVGQGHALARHDDVAAVEVAPRQQFPAAVVLGGRRRREAVIDAAVDAQIAAGAQQQAAHLARTAHASLLEAGIQAGVAHARQIQVAPHHQVAVRRPADDLDAGTQVQRIGIRGRGQAGQLAVTQGRIRQRRIDESRAVAVLAVEIRLVDHLVGAAAGRQVWHGLPIGARHSGVGRVVIALHGVDGDGFRAADGQAAAGRNGNVAKGGGVRIRAGTAAAQTRRVQFHRAACGAVVFALALARHGGRAVAHVDLRAAGQVQYALARIELYHRPVRAVDDLAIAVDAQDGAMRVEHGVAGQGETVLAGQADAAHALAAGIDHASDGETAIVDGHLHFARLQFIADGQVSLFQLEAARARHAAFRQALVQRRELAVQFAARAQGLRAHVHAALLVGHHGAARVVAAAGAAQDLALQVHHAGRAVERHGLQAAGAVVLGRQVDHAARPLADIAGAAVQGHVAAPAVFVHVEEGALAARHVDARRVGHRDVVLRTDGELAAWQHHGRGHADAVAVQGQLGAERVIVLDGRGRGHAGRRRHRQGAARRVAVRGAGVARQQRRDDVQLAAAVLEALARLICTLLLVDGQAALVVGRDLAARFQVDVGKAQRQAVERGDAGRLGERAEAEIDAFRFQVQGAAARAGAVRDHVAGRRHGTAPDQVGRADGGHGAGPALAIHGRRGQHQAFQVRFPARLVVGVEHHVAVEIDAVGRAQHQRLQGGRARAGIAAQQAVQHALVQGQAGGTRAAGLGRRQRLVRADIDGAHGQAQVARAVAGRVVQLEAAAGRQQQGAFRVQAGRVRARRCAHADADAAARRATHGRHVEQAVRRGQHVDVLLALVDEAVVGVVGGLALAQGADAGAGGDIDHADAQLGIAGVLGDQEYFRGGQHGARAQVDGARKIVAEIHIIAALAKFRDRRAAHHDARRADIVQA